MNRFRFLVLALLPLLLGAKCDAVITNAPLADPQTAEPDKALFGHWVHVGTENGKATELHAFIGRHDVKGNPTGVMEAVMMSWNKDDQKVSRDGQEKVYFSAAEVGGERYLCQFVPAEDKLGLDQPGSYATWAKNKKKCCFIARYKCDAKTFTFWLPKEDSIAKLIKSGDLKESSTGVVTAESLTRYLAKNDGEALFSGSGLEFTRVK